MRHAFEARGGGGALAAAAILLLFLLAVAAPADAQITPARIEGFVTDPSGAVVPGATVTATHTGTNESRATVTGSRGGYLLSNLPLGAYA